MAYRNYAPANGFIVSKDGTGDFTTINAAITAATSGQTIFLKLGIYTENLTISKNLNITAWVGDSYETDNVTIKGKITITTAIELNVSNIRLRTNNDYFLEITGSAATTANFEGCYLEMLNNTGIHITSSSSSSEVAFYQCTADHLTTGISLFTFTGSGTLTFYYCQINNSANTTTSSTISAGGLTSSHSAFFIPLTTSGTSIFSSQFSEWDTTNINTTALTIGGSGLQSNTLDRIQGGTASAISISSTLYLNASYVDSTNAHIITGAGILNYSGVVFPVGDTGNINTSTINPIAWSVPQGGTAASSFNINGPVIAGTTTTSALSSITLSNQQMLVGNTSAAPTAKTWSTKNQTIGSTGTYTPTSGMVYCQITCLGGGGAGGGAAGTGASQVSVAGGGGSGEYAVGIFSAATIGASQSVTIGSGGTGASGTTGGSGNTTSVGALISAAGGSGGTTSAAASSGSGGGGAGGSGGSGGDYRVTGNTGGFNASTFSPVIVLSGAGANSPLGPGGAPSTNGAGGTTGNAGGGRGSGGSGTVNFQNASASTGGAGAAGFVIIQEYILS